MSTRKSDTYALVEALRPTDVSILLANAGLVRPNPILTTYRGKAHGLVVRHQLGM